MANSTLNAAEIHGVYEKALCEMPNGNNVKKGDIVICSVNEGNFSEPCCLGVVLMVKDVNLGPGHNDGEKGQVFVLPFDKQNTRGKHTLTSLKSKLNFA